MAAVGGRPVSLHSLPGYYGGYVAIWVAVPAALILLLAAGFGGRLEAGLLRSADVPAIQGMDAQQRDVFFNDAVTLSQGGQPSETLYEGAQKQALDAAVKKAAHLRDQITYSALGAALILAFAGAAFALPKIRPDFRARNRVESWIAALFILCSVTAVLTTVGIVGSLVWESWRFFQSVSPIDFLFGMDWDPQIAMRTDQYASSGAFGAVPLFIGTGGPTVVYGFFAALTVGPLFREFFNTIGAMLIGGGLDGLGLYLSQVQNQMALVAGAVMGVMLIPFVSSLSDDIINAVPQALRDGSLAMGATRSETVKKVVLPAALPGIMAAMLLAVSRAVGETMIVTMAAGLQANVTVNPLDTVTTVTVQIVTLLTGDQEFDSPKTLAAFGLGLTLFVVTLTLNIIALRIVQKYREQYD